MENPETALTLPHDTDYWIMAQKEFQDWECPDIKGVNERLDELFDQIADVEITEAEAGDILARVGMEEHWRYTAARDFRVNIRVKALIEIWTYRKTSRPSEVVETTRQEEEHSRQKFGVSPERAKAKLEFLGFKENKYADDPYIRGDGSHETRALIAITGYPRWSILRRG